MHAKAGDEGDVDVGMAPRGPRGDAEEAGRNAWMSWFWEENSDKYIGFGVKLGSSPGVLGCGSVIFPSG